MPQKGILDAYGTHLEQRKKLDRMLVVITPCAFVIAWIIDLLIYFA